MVGCFLSISCLLLWVYTSLPLGCESLKTFRKKHRKHHIQQLGHFHTTKNSPEKGEAAMPPALKIPRPF